MKIEKDFSNLSNSLKLPADRTWLVRNHKTSCRSKGNWELTARLEAVPSLHITYTSSFDFLSTSSINNVTIRVKLSFSCALNRLA
eukprot:scaffold353527_cov46-Prasinocladus_malaysianus.AAC.1